MSEIIKITKKQVSQIKWLEWNGVLSISNSYTDEEANIEKDRWVEYVKMIMDSKKINKVEKKDCGCKNKKKGPAATPAKLPPSTENIKI